jgi:hypothetical protein
MIRKSVQRFSEKIMPKQSHPMVRVQNSTIARRATLRYMKKL